jgi:hypothetical protein
MINKGVAALGHPQEQYVLAAIRSRYSTLIFPKSFVATKIISGTSTYKMHNVKIPKSGTYESVELHQQQFRAKYAKYAFCCALGTIVQYMAKNLSNDTKN